MEFQELLKYLLYGVITTAVPVLVGYVVQYLKGVLDKLKLESSEIAIGNTISEVLDLVLAVVMKTSQTYVDSLKKSGNFDEESQKIAFETTKSEIMHLLSEESKEIIKTLYNDVDNWITVQIESAVLSIKNN